MGRGVYTPQRLDCSWGTQKRTRHTRPPSSSSAHLSDTACLNPQAGTAGEGWWEYAIASKGDTVKISDPKI